MYQYVCTTVEGGNLHLEHRGVIVRRKVIGMGFCTFRVLQSISDQEYCPIKPSASVHLVNGQIIDCVKATKFKIFEIFSAMKILESDRKEHFRRNCITRLLHHALHRSFQPGQVNDRHMVGWEILLHVPGL